MSNDRSSGYPFVEGINTGDNGSGVEWLVICPFRKGINTGWIGGFAGGFGSHPFSKGMTVK
jgi:hypothetical protein